MNTVANSANSICGYCGAIYNAKFGNHICEVEALEALIDQERTMTDEPDERTIAKLEARIQEVKEFWHIHPNHKRELSRHIAS
jgi:hypothetical protein